MTPNTKRLFSLGLLALTFLLATAGPAARADAPLVPSPADQPASPRRLAVVDMDAVVRGTQAGRAMLTELEGLMQRKRSELEAAQNEAKAIRAKAVELAASASQKQLADLQRQYDEKMADLRRLRDEANQEVNKRRLELLDAFHKRALPVIGALGREQGYAVIWRKGEAGMLYVDSQLDLTAQVVERLNTP